MRLLPSPSLFPLPALSLPDFLALRVRVRFPPLRRRICVLRVVCLGPLAGSLGGIELLFSLFSSFARLPS
jgi:hypothetical protein